MPALPGTLARGSRRGRELRSDGAFEAGWCSLDGNETAAGPHEATIAQLQAAMADGTLTARALVEMYCARIAALDRAGPRVNAVVELNLDARRIADELDRERRERGPRGPLHGIPILLKDNIETGDQMLTTAGSLALAGAPAARDATVARRLREAGAVILGKTNLSEWANFRSTHSFSGWSARGGRTRNPYALDRNPSGSSSGSAAAVAAGFCAAALGTETNGSIVSPSSACGVVGIKPTVGLTSRAGVVPIAHSHDTVGVHARTVADAAAVLGALVGADPADEATRAADGKFHRDYTRFLDPGGLSGARIGVVRAPYFGRSDKADRVAEAAVAAMRDAGATVVDPADLPSAEALKTDRLELEVLLWEFKADLEAYLATRPEAGVRTLDDLIAFNRRHADRELVYFGQELFEMAREKGPLTDPAYREALETIRRLGGADGIDAALDRHELDALVCPTGAPAWVTDVVNGDPPLGGSSGAAARAGYPLVTVPAGFVHGLPVGLTFMGRAWSEPVLIRLAYAFEQLTQARRPPAFRPGVQDE